MKPLETTLINDALYRLEGSVWLELPRYSTWKSYCGLNEELLVY